jgi:hypothetical protein
MWDLATQIADELTASDRIAATSQWERTEAMPEDIVRDL